MSKIVDGNSSEKTMKTVKTEEQLSKSEVSNFIQTDEFKEIVKKASTCKIDILKNILPEEKSVKDEFVDYMLQGCGDLSKDEKKSKKKEFTNVYKKLVGFQHLKDGVPGENSVAKLKQIANDVEIAVKYFDFMGNDVFKKYLSERGIYIDYSKSTSLKDEYKGLNESTANNLQSIIDDGEHHRATIRKTNDDIKNNIFNVEIPEELQYSKENKCGLKIAGFNKFVKAQVLKAMNNEEKLEKYITNEYENSEFNIAREEILKDGLENIK